MLRTNLLRIRPTIRGLVIGLAALAFAGGARAAESIDQRLSRIEDDIQAIDFRAEEIQRQIVPGHGFMTETQAVRRFEEHLYEFMVGEYDRSAEGFFALVTTGALAGVPGLHLDSEWYLAESLYKMGNYDTAEARFRVIVEDRSHPFHDDGVRRLLELYATSGQTDKFREAYEREIVRGNVKPSDLITYSLGKSFYRAGDLTKAKSQLSEIAPESPMYNKARYFLGTVAITEGDLDGAAGFFEAVLDVSVDTVEDRQVLDLALLALGRIRYEQGRFDEAAEYYGRIGGDSVYLADKLYEIVWTFIKQEAWQEAQRGVEIFVLAFPEHQYTAQLKLIQGHLHMKEVEYDSALASYEQVIADYTPIRERFEQLANGPAGATYFRELATSEDGKIDDPGLPPYAVSMMTTDPDLARALDVYREIERQDASITKSEAIIAELEAALAGSTTIGGFERIREDVTLLRMLALQQRLDLLRVEEDWLWSGMPRDQRVLVEPLRDERQALLDRILNVPEGGTSPYDDKAVVDELDRLGNAYAKLRDRSNADDVRGTGLRFDTAHQVLAGVDQRLSRVGGKISDVEAGEVARIKELLTYETGEVATQRSDIGLTRASAETVAADFTQAGFDRLEEFFADSVLRADMGIVDVYWAQKVEVADRREEMIQRKNDLMAELETRFELIRQKLPPDSPGTGGAGSGQAAPKDGEQ